jgi:hypothetical protein
MASLSHCPLHTHVVTEDRETPHWVEREVAHSRHTIANARLVVTFSAALAATFVSAFMNENPERGVWDEVALVFMGLTLLYTIRVVLLRHKSQEGPLDLDAYAGAKTRADKAHRLMVTQVVFSLLSVVAVVCQLRL